MTTTLKQEEPLAVVVDNEYLGSICSFCFSKNKLVRRCTGCQVLSYCNEKCQKGDWRNHKKECRVLKSRLATDVPAADVRLAMRLLLKSKEELAEEAFNGRTWDSLDDNLDYVRNYSSAMTSNVIECITLHVQIVKNITVKDATKVYGKVLNNSFIIFENYDGQPVGMGLYVGLSIHKHSCVPDAQLIFNGATALISGTNGEKVYSPNLTINYTNAVPWSLDRKYIFKKTHFYDCTCPLCSDENHIFNRMGSSCRVNCCEDAAGILDENSSGPYTCNKCGTYCRMPIHEVKRVEAKILGRIAKINSPDYNIDVTKIRSIVQESEMVLSIYNFHFLGLCDAVIVWINNCSKLSKENIYRMAIYLYDKKLKAVEYYLHDSDKRKTCAIRDRAFHKMTTKFTDNFNIDQALYAMERTYGKKSLISRKMKTVIDDYNKGIAIKREEEYKAMCQYGW